MSTYYGIKRLGLDEEKELKDSWVYNFVDFGITSIKSAIFLNFLLWQKLRGCPSKRKILRKGTMTLKSPDTVVGGGVLVKAEAKVTISDLNNVGIVFDRPGIVMNYIRIAGPMKEDLRRELGKKIADELKKEWYYQNGKLNEKNPIVISEAFARTRSSSLVRGKNKLWSMDKETLDIEKYLIIDKDGNRCIEISYDEYKTLYEFLKGRSVEKIIKDHGQKAYDSMIGKKVEDQAIINEIEKIRSEIKDTFIEFNDTQDKIEFEEYEAIEAVKEKYIKLQKNLEADKDKKIEELNEQITGMIKLSGSVAGNL